MAQIAEWICDILDNMGDETVVDATREKVKELCDRFPVYRDA
jgi:glycine hydroxymethyltransferase